MSETQPKRVVIIGGGLAGLSAAYHLLESGYTITLLEAGTEFGGLAGSIRIEDQAVERFYHFICRSDDELTTLAEKLGLNQQLNWEHTRTAFYHEGRSYPFGTPFDLLRFRPVPWLQRLRFGLHVVFSRYRSHWQNLDQVAARPWLIRNIGAQAYQVIWHPLLKIKFGERYDKISAAWIWHRIWRVARSRRSLLEPEMFGYFEGGSETLVNRLVEVLIQGGADLRKNCRVEKILLEEGRVKAVQVNAETIPCQAVISSAALPVLTNLLPAQDSDYFRKLKSIEYIGVVCLLLSLKQPFSRNFWTNTNDARIAFNGFIEQTNLNRHLQHAGLNLVYIPYYLDTKEARYRYADEDLLAEYISALQLINPQFDASWIKEWFVFRDPYAQAICTTGFASLVPGIRSPIPGLYVTDSTQFYPEDRTLSAAVRLGHEAAKALCQDDPCAR
ncbi:MAG: hypothetical protein CVU39_11600 [Chloroflexi bacterium HGW-Chloroflexi-10]|nr:MAG: hypothetical protein CVU39_11600 [Chloroflexi bacterium HGW-Chloroflexi-10]